MSQMNVGTTRYPEPSYIPAVGPIFASMDIIAAVVAAIMILGPLWAAAFVVNH